MQYKVYRDGDLIDQWSAYITQITPAKVETISLAMMEQGEYGSFIIDLVDDDGKVLDVARFEIERTPDEPYHLGSALVVVACMIGVAIVVIGGFVCR